MRILSLKFHFVVLNINLASDMSQSVWPDFNKLSPVNLYANFLSKKWSNSDAIEQQETNRVVSAIPCFLGGSGKLTLNNKPYIHLGNKRYGLKYEGKSIQY